jgi:hypothetical protein
MDMQPFARVEEVAEDLDDLWLEVNTLGDRLEELTDSVSFLFLVEDRGSPSGPLTRSLTWHPWPAYHGARNQDSGRARLPQVLALGGALSNIVLLAHSECSSHVG